MKKTIFLLVVLCVSASFSAAVWTTYSGWPWWWENYDIEMKSDSYGWFCGDHGTIARWEDRLWQLSSVPGIYPIRSISSIDDNNAWAVGDAGLILKYDGIQWNEVYSPTTKNLHKVKIIDATHGWAVGNQVVLRYNGTTWTVFNQSSINGVDWQDIWAGDANNVWICGAGGRIAYWNNGSFVNRNLPAGYTDLIYGVWVNSPTDAWVCTYNGRIFHWEGISWSGVFYPVTTKLLAIEFVNAGYGWVVGEGGEIQRWTGIVWSKYPYPQTGNALFSISMIGLDNGWIVGGNGTILRLIPSAEVESRSLGNVRAMYR